MSEVVRNLTSPNMKIRLIKLARQVDRPIKVVVAILAEYGIYVRPKPTTIIEDKWAQIIYKHCGIDPSWFNTEPENRKVDEKVEEALGSSNEDEGSTFPIEQVAAELNLSTEQVIQILTEHQLLPSAGGFQIIAPKQIEILIRHLVENKQIQLTEHADYVEKSKENKAKKQLTKRALRKIERKRKAAKLEAMERRDQGIVKIFNSLVRGNPRGRRGLLGNLWPVKKR